MHPLTLSILAQLEASFGATVAVRADDNTGVVRMVARSKAGEVWEVEGDEEYSVACRLAEAMGFDLRDG